MSNKNEATAIVERFVAPSKVVPFTYHFKRVSENKKPDEFKLLVQAAAEFAHVGVTVEEVKNEATGEIILKPKDDDQRKRDLDELFQLIRRSFTMQ